MCPKTLETNESSKEPRRTTFCLTKSVNNKYPKLEKS